MLKQGHQTVGQRTGRNTSLASVQVTEFNVNLPHHDSSTVRTIADEMLAFGAGAVLETRVIGAMIHARVGIDAHGLKDFPRVAQGIADSLEEFRRTRQNELTI